jgi:hypothetical protein
VPGMRDPAVIQLAARSPTIGEHKSMLSPITQQRQCEPGSPSLRSFRTSATNSVTASSDTRRPAAFSCPTATPVASAAIGASFLWLMCVTAPASTRISAATKGSIDASLDASLWSRVCAHGASRQSPRSTLLSGFAPRASNVRRLRSVGARADSRLAPQPDSPGCKQEQEAEQHC